VFESAELGHSISKRTYAREVPKLREALLDAQYDLFQDGRFPVMVLIAGVDGAGKGETVNLLNEWMDPRHIRVAAFGEPSDEERERPPMWRYWRELPPKGRIGIFFGHWYTDPILDRVYRKTKQSELIESTEQIVRFEKMLTDEGALLLKFWFHLSKEKQKKRLKALEKNPETRWRVTKTDWRHFKLYDRLREVAELALLQTGSASAPWIVVEGEDARYRNLTVGRALLAAIGEFDRRAYSGSRIILLVSDGGAHLDEPTQKRILAGLARNRIALYWIYLRSYNSPVLDGTSTDGGGNAPEIALHNFFQTLRTPYRVYQAEVPEDLAKAVADVGRQQNFPLDFLEQIPRQDFSRRFIAAAAICCLLLLSGRSFAMRSWT